MQVIHVKVHGIDDYQPVVCRTEFMTKLCHILQESGWVTEIRDIKQDQSNWLYESNTTNLSKDSWDLLRTHVNQADKRFEILFLPNHKVVFYSNESSLTAGMFHFLHDGNGNLSIFIGGVDENRNCG